MLTIKFMNVSMSTNKNRYFLQSFQIDKELENGRVFLERRRHAREDGRETKTATRSGSISDRTSQKIFRRGKTKTETAKAKISRCRFERDLRALKAKVKKRQKRKRRVDEGGEDGGNDVKRKV